MLYGFEPKSNYLRWMQNIKNKIHFFRLLKQSKIGAFGCRVIQVTVSRFPSLFFFVYVCLLSTCVPLKLHHTSHRPKEFPKKQKNLKKKQNKNENKIRSCGPVRDFLKKNKNKNKNRGHQKE